MRIVPVKPVLSFCSQGPKTVVGLNVQTCKDNLEDKNSTDGHAVFKYTLFDADNCWAGENEIELMGEDYMAWDSTSDMAYQIVAKAIGLEIVDSEVSDASH
jgi:hypothetical protein